MTTGLASNARAIEAMTTGCKVLHHAIRQCLSFVRNKSGNFGVIFALSAVPLMGMVGAGIDYSFQLSLKAKLDQAADAAAVAGAITAQAYLTANTSSSDVTNAAQQAGQAQASAQFAANTGNLSMGTLSAVKPSVVRNNQIITSTVSYSFATKPIIMQVMGITQLSVAGTSVSRVVLPTYINVYVVIDNSESMGIGATQSDQQKAYTATANTSDGSCALACHFAGRDTESLVHNAGATLRIDVAKQAVVAGLKSIPTGSNYQVAVYTMSNSINQVFNLSNDVAGAINAVNGVDLENGNKNGGTNTTYTLQTLASQLPAAGSGLTPSTAQGVVMLITDAVQDSDMKVQNGGTYSDTIDPNFTKYSPCNQQNCWTDQAFGGVTFEAFDPSQCSAIKSKGYTMMTLDVQYLIPSANMQSKAVFSDVFNFVSTRLTASMTSNMQSCASSSNYAYSASTPTEVSAATTAMFGAIPVAAVARLSQ